MEQLKWEDLPARLDDDELFALAAYTYEFNTGSKEGQLYYELNLALRARDSKSRGSMLGGDTIYYIIPACMTVLSLCAPPTRHSARSPRADHAQVRPLY